jgi:DNA-binding MarR family transcriptional regulator
MTMDHTTSSSTASEATAPRWLDEREHAAWRAFLAMKTQLDARLAADLRQDSGLSSADFAVLVGVSEAPQRRIRAHVLGANLVWEKSRLSKQITRMEARGLVVRESCPNDARGSFVVLTSLGLETIERAAALHVARVREVFFEALTAEQVDQLTAISNAVIGGLGCPASSPEPD